VHQEASAADIKRAFLALAVTVLCTGLIYQSTAFALPKIFSERLSGFAGDSVVGIGGMVTLCYVISAMGQIVGGELADRFQLKFVYLFSQVFQLPVLILAFFLHNPVLVVMAALLARYTPLRWRARVFGAKFLLTLGVSSLGVALIPVIYTLTGRLDVLFIALFAFAATAAIAALLLPGDRVAQPAPAE
jgi:MFS family permease